MKSIQQITLGNLGVLEFTADLIRKVKHIPGDLCEAGVAYGGQLCNMHLANPDKRVFAFDSFEGISEHSEKDAEFTQAHGKTTGDQRKSNGVTAVPLEVCKENMLRNIQSLDKFVFIKGWFVDTLPKLTNETFSAIRLDCDIYEPYKTCLEHLYPRLNNGGVLIIDDFHLSGCKIALLEYFGEKVMSNFVVDNMLGNAYLFKQ